MPEPLKTLLTYLVWILIALFVVWGLFWLLAQVGIVAWDIFNVVFKVIIAIGILAGIIYLLRMFGLIK